MPYQYYASPEEEKEARRKNDLIDKALLSEAKERESQNTATILLLGSSDSGKSTLLKQLILQYTPGFTEIQIKEFRTLIFKNTVGAIIKLLEAADAYGYRTAAHLVAALPRLKELHETTLSSPSYHGPFPTDIVQVVEDTWADSAVKETYKRRREFHLQDTASYFLDQFSTIKNPDYKPTDVDICSTRKRTTEVTETKFMVTDTPFVVYDMGGHRSDRKYWTGYFDNCDAIIFVAAISSYDQVCEETPEVNRLQEALMLFEGLCDNRLLQKTTIILFLNKMDVFKEKLKTSKIADYFPGYTGDQDYNTATRYFKLLFGAKNKQKDRQTFSHITCATDCKLMKAIIAAVSAVIVQACMKDAGFM